MNTDSIITIYNTTIKQLEPFIPQWCIVVLLVALPTSLVILFMFRNYVYTKLFIVITAVILAILTVIAHFTNNRILTLCVTNSGRPVTEAKIELKEINKTIPTDSSGVATFKIHKKYDAYTIIISKDGYRPKSIPVTKNNIESQLVKVSIESELNVEFEEPKDKIDVSKIKQISIVANLKNDSKDKLGNGDVEVFIDNANKLKHKLIGNGKIIANEKYDSSKYNIADHKVILKLYDKYSFEKQFTLSETLNIASGSNLKYEPAIIKSHIKNDNNSCKLVLGANINEGIIWLPNKMYYDKPFTMKFNVSINNDNSALTINLGKNVRILIGESKLSSVRAEVNTLLSSPPKWDNLTNPLLPLERPIQCKSIIWGTITYIPSKSPSDITLGHVNINLRYKTIDSLDIKYTGTANIPVLASEIKDMRIGIGGINNSDMMSDAINIYDIRYTYSAS